MFGSLLFSDRKLVPGTDLLVNIPWTSHGPQSFCVVLNLQKVLKAKMKRVCEGEVAKCDSFICWDIYNSACELLLILQFAIVILHSWIILICWNFRSYYYDLYPILDRLNKYLVEDEKENWISSIVMLFYLLDCLLCGAGDYLTGSSR